MSRKFVMCTTVPSKQTIIKQNNDSTKENCSTTKNPSDWRKNKNSINLYVSNILIKIKHQKRVFHVQLISPNTFGGYSHD